MCNKIKFCNNLQALRRAIAARTYFIYCTQKHGLIHCYCAAKIELFLSMVLNGTMLIHVHVRCVATATRKLNYSTQVTSQ